MKPTEMPLDALAKTLTGRMSGHLNTSTVHILIYDVIDPDGRRIGGKRIESRRGKKELFGKERKEKTTATFFLGPGIDNPFETAERFLKAYQQQLRDEEFEASQPEKKDAT